MFNPFPYPFPTYAMPYMTTSRNKKKFNEDENRAALLDLADRESIGIVHVFNKYYPQGGVTVAFKKSSEFNSTRMVHVAVVTCSPHDTFNKRIGTRMALDAFLDGKTIMLPLLNSYERDDVNGAVKRAFERMLGY